MWLTRLALRNPVFILMMCLMTAVIGLVSLKRLSVDLFPEINLPVVAVATFYPGAGPKDVEQTITVPIERAVAAAPGVVRIESTSKQGFSVVRGWFGFGTDLDNAQLEVLQRVSQVQSQLPPGLASPTIIKFDITNIPVAQVGISAPGLDERELYDLAFNVIQPQLERIPGVASATVSGGRIREIAVATHREALSARGLDILDVVNAVHGANLLLPSGTLRTGAREYNVFSNSQIADPRELSDVVLKPARAGVPSATPVRVGDVADVVDGSADQSEVVRVNGARGVFLRVVKQPDANTIAVVDGLRAALPKVRGIPENLKFDVGFDQSRYIRAAISSLQHEALQGGLLAVAVILFFLLSVSATGIIAIAIPLSIVATFACLYFTGQTLNVFTLGGLALGVGRMVDDSIVELENIHRHLALTPNRKRAVVDAAQEVAMPIFVATVTTIVVFFPIVFIEGIGKYLFMPLALSFSFGLAMSFLVSRTVTPLLCVRMLKAHPEGVARTGLVGLIERMLTALDNGYAALLRRVIAHRVVFSIIVLALFVASMRLFGSIGREFFPETDESQFTASFRAPIGTRVEQTEQLGLKLERAVEDALGYSTEAEPGVVTALLTSVGLPLGRTAIQGGNSGPHAGNLQVNLVAPTQRGLTDVQAVEKVRAKLGDALPGVQVFFSTGGIIKRILNFGSNAPIDVEVRGYDLEAGATYAKELLAKLRPLSNADGRPMLTDLQLSREENYPELNVTVNREKAGMVGISETQVAQTVLASLSGSTIFAPAKFTDQSTGNQYDINVKLADADRAEVSHIADIGLRSPSGGIVPLANVATVERRSGPVQISRKYLQRIIDITGNVGLGGDLGAATDAVEKILAENPPPEGFTVGLSGQSQAQREAFNGLIFAAAMAIALVYMILASQFRSLIDPLVIMFSVPLGVTGVALALYLTKTTLNVNSFMGIIMMVGIVVSNGVLLVDFANVLRRRGVALLDATVEAGKTRLRPILMTTIATIFGLLPMALGLGEGSETNLPLARAVIGGLTISTVFTLFLIPSLYVLLERFTKRDDSDLDAVEFRD
jgi:hydrophobe/amphiphile efflux-1 (HAE1) family protein